MKVVRVQIDFTYEVPDALSKHYSDLDSDFLDSLEKSFNAWENKKDEPRKPVFFEKRVSIGDVEPEEKNAEIPNDESPS